eukprot:TRINITY_DN22694_c0_g1_i1.p1 TRINITY_DN22694_c0_g1~~TRINITY_DN22694_c0_g1_i1.p1  ORF type:complete len:148 (-),score=13.82 TRINITY_DN22694_c0_g1_i1:28-471(-)
MFFIDKVFDKLEADVLPWSNLLTTLIHNICQTTMQLQNYSFRHITGHINTPDDQKLLKNLQSRHKQLLLQLACHSPGKSVYTQLLDFHKSGPTLINLIIDNIQKVDNTKEFTRHKEEIIEGLITMVLTEVFTFENYWKSYGFLFNEK